MNQQNNQFDAHVNVNLNNQYLLQVQHNQRLLSQRKPVGVFWDIENCSIPKGISAALLVQKIRSLFLHFNFIENEFVVVCDVFGISHNVVAELNNMQVNIIHVSSFSKNACDEKLKQLMIRFVNTHGQDCAIILFSSDINFAPILTDIKNRIGVFVILFHHQQVSSALLASSNYHFDYDQFCNIPQQYNSLIKSYEDSNQTMTNLMISNLPKLNDEAQLRALLNRITSNAGGRITNVNTDTNEAVVSFKCRSDALRCHQRVNNRKFHGQPLRARIETKPLSNFKICNSRNNFGQECNTQASPKEIPNKITILKNENRSSGRISPQSVATNDNIDENNDDNDNVCMTCLIKGRKLSKYSNFLLKNIVLNVHISLEELNHRLHCLLEMHSGKLPFNALPDCWLNNFDEEFDTVTEPRVLLEHLVSSVPNIKVKNIQVENEKPPVKYIMINGESDLNEMDESTEFGKKQKRKLNRYANNIETLLLEKLPNDQTGFPSINVKEIITEHHEHFNHHLKFKKFKFSDITEFLSHFKSRFNLYSFGQEILLAFSFEEQLKRFITKLSSDMMPFVLSMQNSPSPQQILMFRNYLNQNFYPCTYGVCYIEDLIKALFENDTNSYQDIGCNVLNDLKKIILYNYPFTQNEKAISLFKSILPKFKEMLFSAPDFSTESKEFYSLFCEKLKTKENIKYFSYAHMLNLITNYSDNSLDVVFSDCDQLILNSEFQFIELGQRFVKIFNELATLLCKNDQYKTNESHVAISIYELLYHYHQRYDSFVSKNFEAKNTATLFEKIIAYFFEFKIHSNFCMVYARSNIYFLKFTDTWKRDIIRNLFIFFVENSFETIHFKDVKQYFQDKFKFCFGLSLFCDNDMLEIFEISKQDEKNVLTIKLNTLAELACKLLTVILLHEKIAFPQMNIFHSKPKWTLDQVENEFYDHFGIAMQYSFRDHDLNQLIESFDWLFDTESFQTNQTIQVKQSPLVQNITFDYSATCNYCQTKPPSETLKELFINDAWIEQKALLLLNDDD